jgi:hypothetical protein
MRQSFRSIRLREICIALVILVSGASTAAAVPITFAFTAEVTGSSLLGMGIDEGHIVTGSFTYDTAGTDLNSSDGIAEFLDTGITSVSFSVTSSLGSYDWAASDFQTFSTTVWNDTNQSDLFRIFSFSPQTTSSTSDVYLQTAQLRLRNFDPVLPTLAPLTSDAIPTTLNLADWASQAQFSFFVVNGDGLGVGRVDSTLTSLTQVNSVPEPSSLVLVGAGIAASFGFRRVRRRDLSSPGL